MEKRVIVIVGPTCSGKTELSIEIAKDLDTEIISADSRQIFEYLTIGTAKPTKKELSEVKHHFVNKLDPEVDYNVSLFEKDSTKIINELSQRNKIPVIVGGSGLYIKAIVDGIVDIDSDEELREKLNEERETFGNEFIYKKLEKLDPKAAETMLPQNWKRVIRAVEVYKLTGKSILDIHKEQERDDDYDFLQFGLNWPREILYKNIENRVEEMIKNGLVEEVQKILEMGYSTEINAMNTVGYKEIISYLNKEVTLERAIELIKRNTRRFAKRQLTWFRRDDRIQWLRIKSKEDLKTAKKNIIENLNS